MKYSSISLMCEIGLDNNNQFVASTKEEGGRNFVIKNEESWLELPILKRFILRKHMCLHFILA